MKTTRFQYTFALLLTVLLLSIKFARADDDDDDNVLGEIVVDLIVGAAVGMCQENAVCNYYLSIITFVIIIITIIGWCAAGCRPCEYSSKDFRRGGTAYIGSRIGRSLVR